VTQVSTRLNRGELLLVRCAPKSSLAARLGEKAMTVSVQKPLIRAADYLAAALVLAMLGFASAFIWALGTRAADALFGWHYHFQSIGDYLGIHVAVGRPGRPILEWDRSFLLLAAAVVSGYSFAGIQGLVDWAQMSPEKREQARRNAREERNAIANNLMFEREKKAARKAAKKPMSGWRRLWIVFSVVFGVIAAIIAWQPTRHDYVAVSQSIKTNDDLWATPQMQNELSRCLPYSAKATYAYSDTSTYTYAVDCENKDPLGTSILWALFPAFFMAVFGLTVRWIYRGFKPHPKGVTAEPAS
jgi:hypothetical protein